MSEAEKQQGPEGLTWEQELEDQALAEAQEKLEDEFDTDFEDIDHEKKGFSRTDNQPFYTEVEDTIEFMGAEVELSITREGGLNTVEYWVDDQDMMEALDMFFEKYTASNGGETMLEPYKYKEIKDTEVLDLLDDFSDHFQLMGPQKRPGNGQPREYPIRRTHMEENYGPEESEEVLLTAEDEQETERGDLTEAFYNGKEGYIPGDALFQVSDPEEVDEGIEGELSISPMKRETGMYNVKLKAEEKKSLTYLINQAAKTLEN